LANVEPASTKAEWIRHCLNATFTSEAEVAGVWIAIDFRAQ